MKKIKQIDLWLQLAALLLSILFVIAGPLEFAFIVIYFAVGGTQMLSFLGHLAAGAKVGLTPGRKRYGFFLLLVIVLLLAGWLCSIEGMLLTVMMLLLLVSPFIAVFYAQLCWEELKQLEKEEKTIDNFLNPVTHETA